MIKNIFFISILFNYLFIYFLIKFSKLYFLDKPDFRSMHKKPTITGGGITFVISTALSCFFIDNKLFIICFPLALIGLLDDVFNLKNIYRYLAQVITAIFIISQSQIIIKNLTSFNELIFSIGVIFCIIFITAIINFINFMDGIDGLIGSCLVIILGFAAFKVDLSLLIIVGGLIGFLFWNWQPSRIFMGDTGSTFLGAILAGSILNTNNMVISIDLIFCASPLFVDSIVCIFRRYIANENIFSPHSLHLYQRLCKAGWSHSKVSMIYFISILILIISCLINVLIIKIACFIGVYLYAIYLEFKFASPFNIELINSRNNLNLK